MNKNCVIQLQVLSVLNIEQINLSESLTDEIRISFRCISPVNETDTFATINRHFDDGVNFDYEMSLSDDVFIFTGSLSMCNRESIDNLKTGEYLIPLSITLKKLLENGHYADSCNPDVIMGDAWFGSRCETLKAAWVSG